MQGPDLTHTARGGGAQSRRIDAPDPWSWAEGWCRVAGSGDAAGDGGRERQQGLMAGCRRDGWTAQMAGVSRLRSCASDLGCYFTVRMGLLCFARGQPRRNLALPCCVLALPSLSSGVAKPGESCFGVHPRWPIKVAASSSNLEFRPQSSRLACADGPVSHRPGPDRHPAAVHAEPRSSG